MKKVVVIKNIKMKNLAYTLLFSLPALFILGCESEERQLEPAGSKLDGIHDEWVLDRAVNFDSLNEVGVDLSTYYIQNGEAPELTMDSENLTYAFNARGKKSYFGSSGTWAFDDPDYPTSLTFTDENGNDHEVELIRTIRPVDQKLAIRIVRKCNDQVRATYNYFFIRK